jgi:hypothetical protein
LHFGLLDFVYTQPEQLSDVDLEFITFLIASSGWADLGNFDVRSMLQATEKRL